MELGNSLKLHHLGEEKLIKKIKLGICGEHGGDPKSIEFCSRTGLDYVSCSLLFVFQSQDWRLLKQSYLNSRRELSKDFIL